MSIVAQRGSWTVVRDVCPDGSHGFNYYVMLDGDLLGSIDCLANEGYYEDARGFVKPVPASVNRWLWNIIEDNY